MLCGWAKSRRHDASRARAAPLSADERRAAGVAWCRKRCGGSDGGPRLCSRTAWPNPAECEQSRRLGSSRCSSGIPRLRASHGRRTGGQCVGKSVCRVTGCPCDLRLRGRRTTRKRGTSDLRLQRKIGQKGIRSAAVRQDFLEGNWLRFAPPSRRATPPRQPPSGGCACDRGVKSSAPRSRAAPARPGRRPRPPASVFWARARLVFASRLHSRR